MTNAELIEALRVFWPENGQEAAAFLDALKECADTMTENISVDPGDWKRFVAVADALDVRTMCNAAVVSPAEKLLAAAAQEGLTIDSAAALLGVPRGRARRYLEELRAAGSLRVAGQGRASRWVRTAE